MKHEIIIGAAALLGFPGFALALHVVSNPTFDLGFSTADTTGGFTLVSDTNDDTFPSADQWEIVFADASYKAPEPTAATVDPPYYYEFQLALTGPYDIVFADLSGSGPVTLSNAGFFLSPTEIPLDQLDIDFPNPPNPPMGFTALPSYVDSTYPNSSTAQTVLQGASTPTPTTLVGSLVLMSFVGGCLGLKRWRGLTV